MTNVRDPLVSVITPCLNPGPWLERCLKSVAAQTYRRVEHIVVDGGSTDGTVELLRNRGARFISEPDSGQSNAINKGFRLAQGDLLGWLNADDELLPDAVERIAHALRADSSAGWAYGRCRIRRDGKLETVLPPPRRMTRRTLDAGNLITQPGFFLTRSAFEQVGELDESLHLGMDFDLWLRLLDAGIAATYVSGTLAIYNIHETSKTGYRDPGDFIREEAEVLLKSGRRRQAAFAFGRAALITATCGGAAFTPPQVREIVRRALDDPSVCARGFELNAALSGASVEAAMLEFHQSPRGIRHVLRPGIWLYPETRARLVRAIRFALHAAARRLLGAYDSADFDPAGNP